MAKRFPNKAPLYKKLMFRTVYKWTAPWRRLPDYIIIGVQKGGTSSLYRYLIQHPDNATPFRKQLHFFDGSYHRGINHYKKAFPLKGFSKGKITGEATPYYIFFPPVAERVHQEIPKVKLVLMFRDPVNRAYSHYQMKKEQGWEKAETFEEAINLEEERLSAEVQKMEANPNYYSRIYRNCSYMARGYYADQLERWLKYFPREQMLILQSEKFFEDPMKSLEQVYDFLGMEYFRPPDLKAFNSRDYDPLEPALRKKLNDHFQPHNERLYKLIGERYDWGE